MGIRKIVFFLKRDLQEALTYKVSLIFDVSRIAFHLLVFYFVGRLVGKEALAPFGVNADYFSYALTGIALAAFQNSGLTGFSAAVQKEVGAGTLETVLLSGTRLETLLLAVTVWNFITGIARVAGYFLLGLLLGFPIEAVRWDMVLVILVLFMASVTGVGLASAASVLVFKRGDPVGYLFNGVSRLAAGVYFPISFLPPWTQPYAYLLPLTHAVIGLRKCAGIEPGSARADVLHLAIFAAVLLPAGLILFHRAVEHCRKNGTLHFT